MNGTLEIYLSFYSNFYIDNIITSNLISRFILIILTNIAHCNLNDYPYTVEVI